VIKEFLGWVEFSGRIEGDKKGIRIEKIEFKERINVDTNIC